MIPLNIIGAGRVGRTLAALWKEKQAFTVQDVADGTPAGAQSAVAFIGEGRAVTAIGEMRPAHVWMISTPDRAIARAGETLAAAGLLRPGDIVFHCSGSASSSELAAAAASGARVASVHPLKTFADARDAVRTFTGTYCAAEGDESALAVLTPAFERIGGRVARIDPQAKTLYHAASVIVCNDLAALIETGLRCYERAGLDRQTAASMIEPLVRETLDNVLELGPARALTGPVARGDADVVRRHLEALDASDPRIAAIYRDLGAVTAELALALGEADPEALRRIRGLLDRPPQP
jgi:predicted short-subunit dehydrogenase-like oxidoreductase (DUF2520 family)